MRIELDARGPPSDWAKPARSLLFDLSTTVARGFCTGAATSQAQSGFANERVVVRTPRYMRPVSQNGPGHSNGSMRPYSDQSELSNDVFGADTGNGSYFAGFANRRVHPVNEIALEYGSSFCSSCRPFEKSRR